MDGITAGASRRDYRDLVNLIIGLEKLCEYRVSRLVVGRQLLFLFLYNSGALFCTDYDLYRSILKLLLADKIYLL